MAVQATVELAELELALDLGTYGPDDVVPDVHILDMSLSIDPSQGLVSADEMVQVFDYDPLIAEILRLAGDGHYETQEWLMTRIARACAVYAEIKGAVLHLYKRPVDGRSGRLGVRVAVDGAEFEALREA